MMLVDGTLNRRPNTVLTVAVYVTEDTRVCPERVTDGVAVP